MEKRYHEFDAPFAYYFFERGQSRVQPVRCCDVVAVAIANVSLRFKLREASLYSYWMATRESNGK